MNLNDFKTHVPEDLLTDNPNLNAFLDVLNGMLTIRESELAVYAKSFYFPAVTRIQTVRRYIDEYGGEYTDGMSIQCLEKLYNSYNDIYSRKGTKKGVEILLDRLFCVADGTITVNFFEKGKPLILFDDYRYKDQLPNGEDLAGELEAAAGEETYVRTLLDDTWLHSRDSFEVTVPNVGTYSDTFLDFVRGVLYLYLPMVNPNNIKIDFV
jgi:hypothetical protein